MLRQSIYTIWTENIKESYMKGEICTERHLQAELYHYLKSKFYEEDYRIWVEPTLAISKENFLNGKIPDLIMTKGNEIKAVIELKYKPAGEVFYKDDIEKLLRFSKLDKDSYIALKTDPKSGEWIKSQQECYSVLDDCIYIFVVIAKDRFAHALDRTKWGDIDVPSNFLHLVGKIDGTNNPVFKEEIKLTEVIDG